jgi:AAA+ ATPase superfamily predicted ATPase
MIGRGEDVEELVRSLGNGVHRIITGPRRTGKTSVGHAALARLREQDLYVVAVDLFDVSDAAELAEALVAGTVANRPAIYKALHKVRRAGEIARKTVDTAAVMKLKGELGEEIEFMLRPGGASSDPDRFLKYAL